MTRWQQVWLQSLQNRPRVPCAGASAGRPRGPVTRGLGRGVRGSAGPVDDGAGSPAACSFLDKCPWAAALTWLWCQLLTLPWGHRARTHVSGSCLGW